MVEKQVFIATHFAAGQLAELSHQYGLSQPERGQFCQPAALRMAVAAAKSVTVYAYGQWQKPLWQLPLSIADSDAVCALAAVPYPGGTRLAVGTTDGHLILLQADGQVIQRQRLSEAALWHLTVGRLRDRPYLFSCGGDSAVRICDLDGRLLSIIEAPRPLLSLAVTDLDGRTLLAGGGQTGAQIYVWDLAQALVQRAAVPILTLRGGRCAAFSVCFCKLEGNLWLAHGSWDGWVYLYDLGRAPGRRQLMAATICLEVGSPVYPLLATAHPTLLAGTAAGSVLAWDLVQGVHSRLTATALSRLDSSIIDLATVTVSGSPLLFVAERTGGVHQIELSTPAAARCEAVLTGGGCGMAMFLAG